MRWTWISLATVALALAGCPDTESPDDDTATDDDATPDDDDTEPVDEDGDGWTAAEGDCDDANAAVHPDAVTLCDGVADNDCDGAADPNEIDADGDGYDPCHADCDDTEPAAYPGAEEICDGVDNDCDATLPTDEADADGDGYRVCEGDCDDSEPLAYPGGVQVDCDGVDNDCSGVIEWLVPGDQPTIQAAIEGALDGDSICVDAGTYDGTLDFEGKAVRIVGVLGAPSTVLDGHALGSVATFTSGEDADSVLEGFTITGGSSFVGGGVRIEASSPTLRNLVITGNIAMEDGGGVYVGGGGAPLLEDVELSLNEADDRGAGLYASDSHVDMSRLWVHDNSAYIGGGVYLWDSSSSVSDSLIEMNVSSQSTGGIALHLSESGSHDLVNVVVRNNTSGATTGGLYASGTVRMTNVLVTDNAAGGDGGGIYLLGDDSVLENVAVIGNEASTCGGIMVRAASTTLSNVIVAGNHGGEAGGLCTECTLPYCPMTMTLINLAVVGNTAGSEAGISLDLQNANNSISMTNVVVTGNEAIEYGGGITAADHNAPVSMIHCDVWGNLPEDYTWVDDATGTDGNVSVDPLFLDVSAADPRDWDLHLGPSSPLIDTGDATIDDPDGSPSDMGPYGGPAANGWDLDWDGFFDWWQPGPYDAATYPALGWDCDDRDESVFPGSGC
jgi:hypothetical protein